MQIIRDTSAINPEPSVATIGFFDGVHAGHRYLIQQVKEIAAAKGLRSALVTFPVHPRKVMNVDYRPELLTTPEEKISLLADIGVDYCLMLDFTPEVSRLTAREFMTQLLKERYQVGRKIGFPTANLSVDDPDKLIPADGVYAVWVTFDKKTYMGMLNIGVRPTIDNGPNRTIEVNILHFHSDIYDKFIRLTFVKRTRPELKFSSIDELIVQLHKDAEETEAILLASKAGSNSRETK